MISIRCGAPTRLLLFTLPSSLLSLKLEGISEILILVLAYCSLLPLQPLILVTLAHPFSFTHGFSLCWHETNSSWGLPRAPALCRQLLEMPPALLSCSFGSALMSVAIPCVGGCDGLHAGLPPTPPDQAEESGSEGTLAGHMTGPRVGHLNLHSCSQPGSWRAQSAGVCVGSFGALC